MRKNEADGGPRRLTQRYKKLLVELKSMSQMVEKELLPHHIRLLQQAKRRLLHSLNNMYP